MSANSSSTLVRSTDEVALDIASFLRDALLAHQQPQREEERTSILINHVDADQFSPLRELAPSRATFLLDPRNCVQQGARPTRALVFSILVFRLISFNTEALKIATDEHRQTHFQTLDDWHTYLAALKGMFPEELTTFFCNKAAYGRGQRRSTDNAAQCWQTSEIIAQHLQKLPSPAPFTEVGAFIKRLKANMLPSAGLLVQVLILGDLAYAGAIEMPTAQEMEDAIRTLKMGGYDALDMLGIPLAASKSESSSFVELYHLLGGVLSSTEKEAMRFDAIMLEHTLCKIKRCRTTKGIARAGAYMKGKAKKDRQVTRRAVKRKSSTAVSSNRVKQARPANTE